jgi:predicted AlkP superfamily pyrophosphatase or phosphodiesterase
MRFRLVQKSLSRRLLLFISLCALVSIAASNAQQPTQSNPPKQEAKPKPPRIAAHVVIVSISGLRADYITNPASYRLRIPNLLAMRNNGAHAVGVESVYPSLSNPAHATMVTGVLPADHGITADFPFDETTGAAAIKPHLLAQEIKTEAIWVTARRDGLSTAAVGWPLTAGAAINFNLPAAFDEQGSPADQASLRSYINPLNLLEQLAALRKVLLPADEKISPEVAAAQTQDEFRTEAAAALIEKERPNLLLVHLNSLKAAQQRYGIQSTQVGAALERLDAALAKITGAIERAKLTNNTTFIVLADSGATSIEREYRPNVLLARKEFLTADAQGRITSWRAVAQTFDGSAAVFIKDPKDEVTARAVEKLFNEVAAESDSPLWRVTPRSEAAKLGADPRAYLYLDAAPLYALSPDITDSRFGSATKRAAQGYMPSRAEMRAALIISGTGIKPKTKIEYARLLDIAPTVARLLGLEMKTARGRVIAEVITQ